jgi:hypothetical protein
MMATKGNQNDAVHNAIIDFLNSGGTSLKRDNVFSVGIEDIGDTIIGVSIFGDVNKLVPTSKNKIGTSQPGFPTRYFEREGKLFYWYDPDHPITTDLIAILSMYKHIDSLNVNGFVGIPSQTIDESKKATDYFFCKCDLQKYKRIRTSIAMGYYKPPELECSCK